MTAGAGSQGAECADGAAPCPEPLAADMALLRAAVIEAGARALALYGRPVEVARKADGTEVSEADHAANAVLEARLMGARPDYGWLSEESADDEARLSRRHVWIVDPIDGTRAFLRGRGEWTVSAALVEDGAPVLAIVFNPVTGERFEAVRGAGACLFGAARDGERGCEEGDGTGKAGQPLRVSRRARLDGARLIVAEGFLRRREWRGPWPRVERLWVNSIAYRVALVAAGRAEATVSLGPKSEWDLAAASLLVQEAGGIVSDGSGAPLTFNRPHPRLASVVAAGPALYAEIMRRLAEAGLGGAGARRADAARAGAAWKGRGER